MPLSTALPIHGVANDQIKITHHLNISDLDSRSYRGLTLPIEIDVLCVSGLASQKVMTSPDVSVDSFSDP